MMNANTGKIYQGKNYDQLVASAADQGFNSSQWVTFVQARNLGLKIKKGAKGTKILCMGERISENAGAVKYERQTFRYAVVFNLDQCEKIEVSSGQ